MPGLVSEAVCGEKEKLNLTMFYKKPRIAPGFCCNGKNGYFLM